jgi:hypothetical protein
VHLDSKLNMLEASRAAADARAADAERRLAAVCTELVRCRGELEKVAGQRDGLASALAEWSDWRGNLVRRLAQAVEAQRRWLSTVDSSLLQALGTHRRDTNEMEVAQEHQSVEGAGCVKENALSQLDRLEAMAAAGEMVCDDGMHGAVLFIRFICAAVDHYDSP